MALFVQKYGGTSIGSPDRIKAVAQRIGKYLDDGHQVVVVVSAMSGETNRLLELGQSVAENPQGRELDVLLASGEQVTIALLSMALAEKGYSARSYLGGQVQIQTDAKIGRASCRERV